MRVVLALLLLLAVSQARPKSRLSDFFGRHTNKLVRKQGSALPSAGSPRAEHNEIDHQRAGRWAAKPNWRARFANLDNVLKSKKAREVLRKFMTTDQRHMLAFWEDVQRYRSEAYVNARVKFAQTIFTSYLKVRADKEVILDRPVRDDISCELSKAPKHLFDAAEREVVETIHRDVFDRFQKSPLFERLAGLA